MSIPIEFNVLKKISISFKSAWLATFLLLFYSAIAQAAPSKPSWTAIPSSMVMGNTYEFEWHNVSAANKFIVKLHGSTKYSGSNNKFNFTPTYTGSHSFSIYACLNDDCSDAKTASSKVSGVPAPIKLAKPGTSFDTASGANRQSNGDWIVQNSVSLSLSSNVIGGATTRYKINGGSYLDYTGAINLSSSATVTAYNTKSGYTDSDTVSITFIVNTPPVANSDTATVNEGLSTEISVLGNDIDADSNPLSITGNTNGTYGSVSCSASSCTYTADTSITSNQNDSFTYQISDGRYGNSTGTVNVSVNNVTQGVVAQPTFSPNGGEFTNSQSITITSNTAGSSIKYRIGGSGAFSTYSSPFTISSTATIYAYATKTDYQTSSTVSKVFTKSIPKLSTPTVSINSAGGANRQSNGDWIVQNSVSVGFAPRDSGASIKYKIGAGSYVNYTGAVTLNSSTTITAYANKAGFTDSNTVSRTFIVNTPPVANSDTATVNEGLSTEISVLSNDTDTDSNPLSITGNTNGTYGSVSCSASSCTYTADTSITSNQNDSFTYQISDGRYGSSTGIVNVSVANVNQGTVSQPSFTPDGGPFTDSQTITLIPNTSGSTIQYRVGSSGSFSLYSGPFTINSSATVYAYASKPDYQTSSTLSRAFTKRPPIPTNLSSDEYNSKDGKYQISWSSVGPSFYRYQLRRTQTSSPTSSIIFDKTFDESGLYKDESKEDGIYKYDVRVCSSDTLCSEYSSEITVTVAKEKVISPTISLPPGIYNGTQQVTLSPVTDGSSIRWRFGSSTTYLEYDGTPIDITQSGALWTYAYKAGMESSGENATSYTIIQAPANTPVLTVPDYQEAGDFEISWTEIPGATYKLEVNGAEIDKGTSRIHTDTGSVNQIRRYRVTACYNSCADYPVTETTVEIKPDTPTMESDEYTSQDGDYKLTWNSVGTGGYRYIVTRTSATEPSGTIIFNQTFADSALRVNESHDNGTYNYVVQVCSSATNCSHDSAPITVIVNTVQVSAPTISLPTGTYNGTQQVTLSPVTDGSSIRWRFGSSTTYLEYDGTPIDITQSGALWTYAYKAGMESSGENATSYTIIQAPANTPVLTVPDYQEAGDFEISWTEIPGATYKLEVNGAEIDKGTSRIHTDTGSVNQIRRYRVTACYNSCADYPVTETTVEIKPDTPTMESDEYTSQDGEYELTWNSVGSGGYRYIVTRTSATEPSGTIIFNQTFADGALKVNESHDNGTYDYVVQVCSSATNCSQNSETITVVVDLAIIPINSPVLEVEGGSDRSISGTYTILWEAVEFANRYQKLIGVDEWEDIPGENLEYIDRPKGFTYTDSIRACTANDCGPESVITVYVPPETPVLTGETESLAGPYILSWNKVTPEGVTYTLLKNDVTVDPTLFELSETYITFAEELTEGLYEYSVSACAGEMNCSDFSTPLFSVDIGAAGPSDGSIDFSAVEINPYGDDTQYTGSSEVLNGGAGLKIQGQNWIQIPLNYTVTANTVVEFEYSSSVEGLIHAFGLNTSDLTSQPPSDSELYGKALQLFGSKNDCSICRRHYKDYVTEDGKKLYKIPLGKIYTGEYSHLFFGIDTNTSNSESTFNNVKIYESEAPPVLLISDDADSGTYLLATGGKESLVTGFAWKNRHTKLSGSIKRAVFYPVVQGLEGDFIISLWHSGGSDEFSANVAVTALITKLDGSREILRLASNHQVNKSQWISIGVADLTDVASYVLSISSSTTSPGSISVDAIRHTPGYKAPSALDVVKLTYTNSADQISMDNLSDFVVKAVALTEEHIVSVEFQINVGEWQTAELINGEYTFNFFEQPLGAHNLNIRVTTTNEVYTDSKTFYVRQGTVEKRVIFIHTDLLGSPAAETDAIGGLSQ